MSTAIVVGAGPNGLAAAVALAKAGVQVTVLEAADEIGGGTRTQRGDHSRPAARPLLGDPPDGRRLAVPRRARPGSYGLSWRLPEIDCVHPLDGGSAGVLYRSVEATADGLGTDGRGGARCSAAVGQFRRPRPRTSWGRCCGCRIIR